MTEPVRALGVVSSDELTRSATRLPHPSLRDIVARYHGYRYAGVAPGVHHGLPSTSLTVVLSFDQQVDVGWLSDPGSRRCEWALASGLQLAPAGISHDGTQHGIQLDLTPIGARALLGVPAAALHHELICLEDLVGPSAPRLYDAVAGAPTWRARFAALDAQLLAMARSTNHPAPIPDATLDHAWQRLHAAPGRLPIARLAAEVGWSRRHLAERFVTEFGVGPKSTARLVRFSAAKALLAAGRSPLADVASRCGYADQAHLTREWRELAGISPTGWLREEGTFLQDRTIDV